MAKRRFDFVIYGASGCAGAYIVEEFVKSEFYGRFNFAVAGRNAQKLRSTLDQIQKFTSRDLSAIEILIAENSDLTALNEMAKQTHVLINSAGPFWKSGEEVIQAAVANGTSHLDISGEAVWAERIQAIYNEEAKANGAIVISSCAFDSIPADFGVQFLRQHFDGIVAYAECFVKFDIPRGYSFNFGTLATVLGVIQRKEQLGEYRDRLMPQTFDHVPIQPPKRPPVWFNRDLNAYAIPYPGDRLPGTDQSVVDRTQYHEFAVNGRRPIPVQVYAVDSTALEAHGKNCWFGLMVRACQNPRLYQFLCNHPKLATLGTFSKDGPRREHVKKARFIYYVQGYGWSSNENMETVEPKKKLTIKCEGPDAGYVGTARLILAAALTLIEEREKIPVGGCFTPAVAFAETKILDRLANWGITFKVVD